MASALEEVEGQPSIIREQLAGYRIAAESYGVLNPKQRGYFFPDDVGVWNRYDTTGRTLYVAQTRNGAFTESLYGYRLDSSARTAIEFMAQQYKVSVDKAYELYLKEQEGLGHEAPGTISSTWREGRRLYKLLSSQELGWFDLSTAHSLEFIDRIIGPEIYKVTGETAVDLSHILGSNRKLTTFIATRLRNLRLNDGGFAMGSALPPDTGLVCAGHSGCEELTTDWIMS